MYRVIESVDAITVNDSTELIEVNLDLDIEMLQNGLWEYQDEAQLDKELEDSYISEEYPGLEIADADRVFEDISDMLADELPEGEGKCHVSGLAVLAYNISNVDCYNEYIGNEPDGSPSIESEYYTEDAIIEFDRKNSKIEDIEITLKN